MANLRELRDRIRSVNSTKKITKAQELIATSRITKAQARVEASQPYAHELSNVLNKLAAHTNLDHPMLREREDGKVAAILVVSSDRGMCGGYNNNVFKKVAELEALLKSEGYETVRYVTGNKGVGFYKFREAEVAGSWTGFSQDPTWKATHDVRRHIIDGFIAGSKGQAKTRAGINLEGETVRGFDQVHVVYTEFESMLTQTARVQQLLPVVPVIEEEDFDMGESALSDSASVNQVTPDYDFEPDADTLMEALLPQYVSRLLFAMFLEASASESAARRTAMKSATDNATELVKDLSRVANQARQAQITQEITEIVGGAGALAESAESD
ncbi:F0F1 ATP synthase subunit gamma [Corynebacterium minutissimum]|uniref:ATP synthase gamma chain n=1 Tax=Corynebacterium minutissimum TaxID=38301 RepID=A0A2X4RMK2_9CORY|nr:F0F1 ATP synthase subunit gamma [Corynebacterium minutissimum]KHO29598.1 ATP synthase F0F1 subunit gamma [Corynebacterium minutissimum]QPS58729.1 F0F1 ATP synthase subunit gamma [Corynebacterium minutissimum]QQA80481.1 F0F1 ATP synthase subunit gamma [Corynebacterium minutissimum]SQI00158.1 ATP synthase F0F1 subunit gamma [Corynebacterium minutissimum]VEG05775.1 ATP synthase F0F1 subunit gamma [Corynebacterium minutissimum]